MANLTETSAFTAAIYQLETSDPVLGGPGGISNLQPQQLANRTRFLKDRVDLLESAVPGLATQAYVQAELEKLDHKQSVRAATTANISTTGLLTIDGVSLAANDRVLVKNQTTGAQNGIYVASASAWTRAVDADINAEVTSGLVVAVEEGTLNASTRWKLTTTGVITIGSTALVFADITAGYAPLASPGLTGNPTAPTPAQFDNDQSLATTEFVQRALGGHAGVVVVTADRAVTVADAGKYLFTNANGVDYTLPNPASIPMGTSFRITQGNLTSGGTIATPGGVTIGNITDGGTVSSVSLEQSADYDLTVVSATAYQLTVTRSAGLGFAQSWQSVTRSSGVTYTNSTGKPIQFVLVGNNNAPTSVFTTINGFAMPQVVQSTGSVFSIVANYTIPPGQTYSYTVTLGTVVAVELR